MRIYRHEGAESAGKRWRAGYGRSAIVVPVTGPANPDGNEIAASS